MPRRFTLHYTPAEANALLPRVRAWLTNLQRNLAELRQSHPDIARQLAEGHDLGGLKVNNHLRTWLVVQATLREFTQREILIKDLQRGLVDFPALRDGREVFLCWEQGEERVAHWHELDAGYAGREPL